MSEYKNEIKAFAGQFSKDSRQADRREKEAKRLRKKARQGRLSSKDQKNLLRAQQYLDRDESFE